DNVVSFINVLDEIVKHPALVSNIEPSRVAADVTALENLSKSVREFADKYVAHHDRKRTPTTLTFGKLRDAVETLKGMFRRYYALIMNSDIDLIISYSENPMAIFTFPWI